MQIGAQLFTIRDYIQTVPDIRESFKKIADIGYKTVQVSCIGPIKAEELRDIATENELEIVVTHTDPMRILNETEQVIAEHKIFGCSRIGIGAMPQQYRGGIASCRQFIADYTAAAKKIAAQGLQLYYHNHDFEFAHHDGVIPYDMMLEETSQGEWWFLPDSFWIQYAGRCPAQQIKQLIGRTEVVHLKDMLIRDGKQVMAPVYEGNICFDEVIRACEEVGVKYLLVEQDDCYGKNPFDELKISFNNLKQRGLT